jgi:beta-RFAP synthase
MLDLRGALGRRFGGIGAGLPTPSLRLHAARADRLDASGPGAARALEFGRRFLAHHGIASGASIAVDRTIPEHAGLGSGTQLALAVARALAELYALPTDVAQLARAVGRARRSAIGTWLFAGGGFVLEGGRRVGSDGPAPLLARLAIPDAWRCVLAVPSSAPGVSGDAESTAFAELPTPSDEDVQRVSHLVLMALLPALVEGDIAAFGSALTEIQCINGRWFAPAQGGAFAPGESARLVERMREWGVPGVGQSSWGPAVYGIVQSEEAADMLAERVRASASPATFVSVAPFARTGATVVVER